MGFLIKIVDFCITDVGAIIISIIGGTLLFISEIGLIIFLLQYTG